MYYIYNIAGTVHRIICLWLRPKVGREILQELVENNKTKILWETNNSSIQRDK